MIYLIGGSPRVGKSILGQRVSARLKIGWISTDLLLELLRLKDEAGVKKVWDGSPEAIAKAAEWFYPYLERFVWGVSAHAESYLIEGVDFLPAQIVKLSKRFPSRAVFLGCSRMTLEQLTQFPGCSPGYARLPIEMQRVIVQDVPVWSEYIRQEATRSGCIYVDMSGDFSSRLDEAESVLTSEAKNK